MNLLQIRNIPGAIVEEVNHSHFVTELTNSFIIKLSKDQYDLQSRKAVNIIYAIASIQRTNHFVMELTKHYPNWNTLI